MATGIILFRAYFKIHIFTQNNDAIIKNQHDAQSNLKPGSIGDMVPAIDTKKIIVFDFVYMEHNEGPRMIYLDMDKIKNKESEYKLCGNVINKKGLSDKKEIEIVSETGFFRILPANKGKVVLVESFQRPMSSS